MEKNMRNKYVLLDEINLELIKTDCGIVRMFEFRDSAITWGDNHCNSWQVIEITFNDN